MTGIEAGLLVLFVLPLLLLLVIVLVQQRFRCGPELHRWRRRGRSGPVTTLRSR